MLMKIKKIFGAEVLDSRGTPTVECIVELDSGIAASAIVPSGMSTGSHEALELRDGKKRFNGKGVEKAAGNITKKISKLAIGKNPSEQRKLDGLMIDLDGTKNKRKLGSNAILASSLAIARAGALSKKIELYEHLGKLANRPPNSLPVPFANIINGGLHAGTKLKIQEFMIAPVGARRFSDGVLMVAETYQTLKAELKANYGNFAVNVGDEGGFAPPLANTNEALEFLQHSIEKAGYSKQIKIAIDAAASEFYKNGKYIVDEKTHDEGEMVDFYSDLAKTYGLISIEDPFSEDDWEGFAELTGKIGSKVQIVADDLTVTNVERIRKAVEKKAANCLLLKVNQIGSLSESISAANFAFDNKWKVMVSHRSGETEDAFIADLAVALQCKQIKLGAPCRGERTAKYNRLLRIERILGSKARYGWKR
ncbi:MAG: phosphopyruvate hydratase [Candidatus Micrarchaeota archaeon]